MPQYEAQCILCSSYQEYARPVAACMDTPLCCGVAMRKVIRTAPRGYVMGKFDPFLSPVDGSVITGSRALEEHNKRNNVVSMADGYSDAAIRRGALGAKKPATERLKRELQADVADAVHAVKNGYKPTLEVLDDY